MKFKSLLRTACFAVYISAALGIAAAQPTGVPRQEKLLNGLKILIWNDPAADKVSVKVRIHAGSAFDPQGKEGAMNMLAEAFFPTPAAREFYRDELGGGLDLVTSYDYIQINASADSGQLLPLLESLAAAITNPTIDKETTAQLKTAQLAAISTAMLDPIYVADGAAASRLFGTFPYGRPRLGTAESVGKIDAADLLDLRQRFLTADNATIAVSGSVDPALTLRALRRYFGGWLKSDRRIPSTFRQPDPPPPAVQILKSPGVVKSAYRAAARGAARGDGDYYAFEAAARILDKRFKQLKGETAFVRHEAKTLPGIVLFGASGLSLGDIGRDNEKTVRPAADDFVNKVLNLPVSPEEFDNAKREIELSFASTSAADSWLDVDTFRLASAKADKDTARNLTLPDVQRALDRLRKEPLARILIISETDPKPASSSPAN